MRRRELTDGEPCHHDVDFVVCFSVTASPKVATTGEEMGRIESSSLRLDLLCRGDDGADEYADSLWVMWRRSMKRE